MIHDILRVVFLCLAFHLSPTFLSLGDDEGTKMMTEEQALAIARSGTGNVDAGFTVIAKFEPTPGSKDVARESLVEARSGHFDSYSKGLFANVMRAGGFAVLQFNIRSDKATRLHLVTFDELGKAIDRSQEVGGDLSRSEALEISRRMEEFCRSFFAFPRSDLGELLRNFGGTEVGATNHTDGQGYLAIPQAVRKVAKQPQDLLDLISLYTELHLWPLRHALAKPIYAANPQAAVKQARDEELKLENAFLVNKNENPNFIYDLLDLNSIDTGEKLTARLQWLKDLNSFLDRRSPLALDSEPYKSNASISTLPLWLGVTERDSVRFCGVMGAPNLITVWRRTEGGQFALYGISEGE